MEGDAQTLELYRSQIAKSYYNLGMIQDMQGNVVQASQNYLKAKELCETDPQGCLLKSSTFKKAETNYAVTLEKLNRRDEAIELLSNLKGEFNNEVRVYNNLGIIQKRKGDV